MEQEGRVGAQEPLVALLGEQGAQVVAQVPQEAMLEGQEAAQGPQEAMLEEQEVQLPQAQRPKRRCLPPREVNLEDRA